MGWIPFLCMYFSNLLRETLLVWTRPTAGPIMLGPLLTLTFQGGFRLTPQTSNLQIKRKIFKESLTKNMLLTLFCSCSPYKLTYFYFANRTRLGCSGRMQSGGTNYGSGHLPNYILDKLSIVGNIWVPLFYVRDNNSEMGKLVLHVYIMCLLVYRLLRFWRSWQRFIDQ